MKNFYVFVVVFFALTLSAQQKVAIVHIVGIDNTTAALMNKNGDRISWYRNDKGGRLYKNVKIEVVNVGLKQKDTGFTAVEATPNDDGQYVFNISGEVKIKKVDTTKTIAITVVVETVMGNEVFATVEREYASISEPITLNRYMWREGNDNISPERRLCLSFSAFVNDKAIREKILLETKSFQLTDFALFTKQDEHGDWVMFPEPIKGKISNGTAVELTNLMPSNINPSKPLYVRFYARSKNGNYVWGEYVVAPNEYRKEFRATNYSGEAFNKDAALK